MEHNEVFEMVIRFLAFIAVLFSLSAAHASTITGTGGLTSDGAGAFGFNGSGLQEGTTAPTLSISTSSAGNFFANAFVTSPPPAPGLPPSLTFVSLSGSNLVSTTFGDGFIEILYGASSGSLMADFEEFLVRIDGFAGNASSTQFSIPTSADITVSAVDLSAVPLPAGLPLLIAGVGAFALVRRRSSAKARQAA